MGLDTETYYDNNKHNFILGTVVLYDFLNDCFYYYTFFDKYKMSRFITTSKFSGNQSLNGGHYIVYDLYQLPIAYHKNFEDYSRGTVYIAKYHRRNRVIRFVDTMNFFKTSLENLAKKFGIEKMKKPDYLGKRKPQTKEEWDYLEKYCLHDSYIVAVVLRWLMRKFIEFNTNICVTPSQFSFRVFKTHFIKKEIFCNPIKDQVKIFRAGYFGGRTEAFKLGTIKDKIRTYDFNSAYVYAMKELFLPITPFEKIINPSLNDIQKAIKDNLCLYGKIKINDKKSWIGKIPKYQKNLKFPIGNFYQNLFSSEIKFLYENNLLDKIDFLYIAKSDKILSDFAKWSWKNRLKNKSINEKLEEELYKLIGNSLYGKFAQLNDFYTRNKKYDYLYVPNVTSLDLIENNKLVHILFYYERAFTKSIKPSKNLILPISAEITSYARIYLLKKLLENKHGLLYCDTDSLILKNKKLSVSNELGGLKLEAEGNRIEIFKEKIYTIYNKNKIVKRATKGFPRFISVNNKKQEIKLQFTIDKTCFEVEFDKMLGIKESWIQRKCPFFKYKKYKKTFDLVSNTKRILLDKDFSYLINTKPFFFRNI